MTSPVRAGRSTLGSGIAVSFLFLGDETGDCNQPSHRPGRVTLCSLPSRRPGLNNHGVRWVSPWGQVVHELNRADGGARVFGNKTTCGFNTGQFTRGSTPWNQPV